MIILELTKEDAEMFKRFRQHQDLFETLLDNGIDKMNNGDMVLSFRPDGTLARIKIEQVVHKR